MCQFLLFSQISTTWTFYQRILRTLQFVRTPHHRANLSISQLVQHSHQFQLSLRKNWVRCIIEMGDFIPTCLGLGDTAHLKLRCSVTNIGKWLQAFAVYMSVIVKKQPHCVPDLIGYQILILKASIEYHNDCWLGYNRCFWQQATSQSNCKWSDMDSTLWNMTFTGQTRTGDVVTASVCFVLPNIVSLPPIGVWMLSQDTSDHLALCHTCIDICHHWNEERTPNCSFPNCCYEHICSLCTFNPKATDIHHKAVYCPYHLNQTRSRPPTTWQPQPTPLLS